MERFPLWNGSRCGTVPVAIRAMIPMAEGTLRISELTNCLNWTGEFSTRSPPGTGILPLAAVAGPADEAAAFARLEFEDARGGEDQPAREAL